MDGKGKGKGTKRKRSRSSSNGSTRSRSSSKGSRSSGNKNPKLPVNELLMNACYHGKVDAASKLLLEGANVNFVDGFHYTPLLIAAESGNKELVQLLIANGAIVDDKGPDSFVQKPISTPITLANQEGHSAVVRLLKKNGAILPEPEPVVVKQKQLSDDSEEQKINIEHAFLALMRFIASKKVNNVKEANFLLERIKNGESYVLKSGGNNIFVKNARNINVNQIDRTRGDTPLGNAILSNRYEIVEKLIEVGADVNMRDGDGWVPLKIAYSEGFMKIHKLLIDNGAHYPMDRPS